MSYAGAIPDLPAEGAGADYSDIGREQSTGAAQLPFSASIAETTSDAFMSGIKGVGEYLDYRQAAIGAQTQRQFLIDPAVDPGNAPIDPKEWQKNFPDLGLKFTSDMGWNQAALLVDHRKEQLRREYVLNSSPDSFMARSTRMLTDLAVSAVDPLNVAAAFVPGMGETKAGLWAAKYGKTFARVAEGATAGATGMAALQPIQAAEAQAFQDHYGPMDAFMNVAFGSVLGGGLHAGVGRLSDLLEGAAPETREAALRASVGQALEGRNIDVSPVLNSDPAIVGEGTQGEVAPGLITGARQSSLDFAHGEEPSAVDMAPAASERVGQDVQAKLGDDHVAELQTAMEHLQGYKAQGIVSDAEMAKFQEATQAETEATNMHTETARAAARCLFLHP